MLGASNTPLRDSTVLVTGGAGYVGSILIRRLLEQGSQVICVDSLRFGGDSLIGVWGHPRFVLERVDITDSASLRNTLGRRRVDAVVHLAAIVGDPACKLEPDLARRTNLDASVHLFELAKQGDVQRFVFASTCSNYGRMKSTDSCADESSPLAPVSLYAELKVEFERYLLNQGPRASGISPTILRFSTVYGISPRMRFDLTVNEFTREVALGRVLQVFGEQFWRPYCHVRDISNAILVVLGAKPETVAFNVFNVGGSSENYTKRMLVDEILKQVPDAEVIYVRRQDDPRDYRVSFDRIKDTLGFRISKAVPQGIAEILSCIRAGVIRDPDSPDYSNTPVPG